MREMVREEKGDTYDPICLFDIESDDEWITKKDLFLPIDASWMDIHESFTLEEGAPSKKRKRGIFLTLKHVTLKYIYMLRYSLGYFSLIGPRNLRMMGRENLSSQEKKMKL